MTRWRFGRGMARRVAVAACVVTVMVPAVLAVGGGDAGGQAAPPTFVITRPAVPDDAFGTRIVAVTDGSAVYGHRNPAPGPVFGAFAWQGSRFERLTGAAAEITPADPYGDRSEVMQVNRHGRAIGTSGQRSFVWDPVSGLVWMPPVARPGETYDFSQAAAIDDAGRVIVVALRLLSPNEGAWETWRWQPDTGQMERLGDRNWKAEEVSPDGHTVVGALDWHEGTGLARWTDSGGWEELGDPGLAVAALKVKDDGRVFAVAGGDRRPVVWDPATRAFDVHSVPGAPAFFLVDDSGVFVGFSMTDVAGSGKVVRWSESSALETITPAATRAVPTAVSPAGTIVGAIGPAYGEEGFFWTPATGLLVLRDGAARVIPQAISDDGTLIAGCRLPDYSNLCQPFLARVVPGAEPVIIDPTTTTTPTSVPADGFSGAASPTPARAVVARPALTG